MKTTTSFWQTWWDERAKHGSSDFEIDRGIPAQLGEVERRAEAQFLAAVSPQPHDIVLDAGCGTGVNIARFAPLVKEIIAIDLSQEMLKRAQARISANHIENAKIQQADIMQLYFAGNFFDKVICTSVLQYFNNKECEQALRELIRVCKPGGRIIVHIKNSTSLYGCSLRVLKTAGRLMGRKVTPDYYRPRRWYQTVFERHGGAVVDSDGFGMFTFVPLSRGLVQKILTFEAKHVTSRWLTRFAVNHKMTVEVRKNAELG